MASLTTASNSNQHQSWINSGRYSGMGLQGKSIWNCHSRASIEKIDQLPITQKEMWEKRDLHSSIVNSRILSVFGNRYSSWVMVKNPSRTESIKILISVSQVHALGKLESQQLLPKVLPPCSLSSCSSHSFLFFTQVLFSTLLVKRTPDTSSSGGATKCSYGRWPKSYLQANFRVLMAADAFTIT